MPFQTILPPEALQEPSAFPQAECRAYRSGFLLGTCGGDGRFTISRMISTDPADYLNPALMPGAVLPQSAFSAQNGNRIAARWESS